MRTFLTAFIPFALCLLSACAPANPPDISGTRMWLGVSKQTLLAEWGKPATVKILAGGNTLYQYVRTTTRPFPYPTPSRGVMVVGQGQTIGFSVQGDNPEQYNAHCYTDVEITPDDRIRSVQESGKGC